MKNKKIVLSVIISIFICVFAGLGIWYLHERNNDKKDEETLRETLRLQNETRDIHYSYVPIIKDFKTVEQQSFKYRDTLLLDKCATKLSPQLSKASAAISSATYIKEFVENIIDEMGYESLSEVYDYEMDFKDNDKAAYIVARKKCVNENGDNAAIYLVSVKGTSGNEEWISNLNVGMTGDHEGFYNTADTIKEDVLKTVFDDAEKNGVDKDNIIMWFTGHSRGAAIANIIAGKMDDEKLLPMDNIYCYTFATPTVSRNITDEQQYDNIYNYVFKGDLIPAFSGPVWNYKRYGHDIKTMTHEQEVIIDNAFMEKYGVKWQPLINAESYTALLAQLIGSEDNYNSQYAELLKSIIAGALGRKFMDLSETKEFIQYLYEEFGEAFTNQMLTSIKELYKDVRRLTEKIIVIYSFGDTAFSVARYSFDIMLKTNPKVKKEMILLGIKLVVLKDDLSDLIPKAEKEEHEIEYSIVPGFLAIIHGHSPATYICWMDAVYPE